MDQIRALGSIEGLLGSLIAFSWTLTLQPPSVKQFDKAYQNPRYVSPSLACKCRPILNLILSQKFLDSKLFPQPPLKVETQFQAFGISSLLNCSLFAKLLFKIQQRIFTNILQIKGLDIFYNVWCYAETKSTKGRNGCANEFKKYQTENMLRWTARLVSFGFGSDYVFVKLNQSTNSETALLSISSVQIHQITPWRFLGLICVRIAHLSVTHY